MDESINKKNIIYVFLLLLLFFLFVYKGFILSGDEYLEEYIKYRDSSQKTSQIGMKKGGGLINSNSNSNTNVSNPKKNEISLTNTKIYEVLNNLENLKLNLGSSIHSLKANENALLQSLNKIKDSDSKDINEIIEEINKKKNEVNFDTVLEGLTSNIEVLRNIATNN